MTLAGKTALVTGSTSGIGFGIAKTFARMGANIVMNGFGDQKEIDERIKKLEDMGVDVFYSDADMTDPSAIEAMFTEIKDKFGGVDILVNNAGIQFVCSVEKYPHDKWEKIISLNLSAAFYTSQLAIPYMREQGWGRIINIASGHGLVASPFKSAYVASKHGVVGFTKVLALEEAEKGITCNAICPGYVKTPLVEAQIADTAKERGITEEEVVNDVMLAAQWTRKFVTIEQVAESTAFFCSPAADNITGTTLAIDGGWTAA